MELSTSSAINAALFYFVSFSVVIALNETEVELTDKKEVELPDETDEEPSDEDKYVKQFGNKANHTNEWHSILTWLKEEDQLPVRKLCSAAHKRMFNVGRQMIETLAYKNGTLSFSNTKYRPMRVYFVEYSLRTSHLPKEVKDYMNVTENDRWYITRGLKKGCVFYLNLLNSTAMEFNLQEHICGLKYKYV